MRRRLLVPAAALLLTAGAGAGPVAPPPECVQAAAWVRAHADALPTTLAGVSEFSPAYRRAISDALPPETRVSLWREHLQGFLAPESGLSEAQRAAVREVIARLPALHTPGTGRAEARALGARVAPLFDRELAARVFSQLGPAPAGTTALNCSCARGSSINCPGGTCVAVSCHPLGSGCGLGGAEPCDGLCEF